MEKEQLKKFLLTDFEIVCVLGRGEFKTLKLVKSKINQKYFVVKIIQKNVCIDLLQGHHMLNQIRINSLISHPFITIIEGFYQDNKCLYFLHQFITGGQLFQYLRSMISLQFSQVVQYAAQVTLIIEYLQLKNIVYRDLKPQNLLINSDGYLKLMDFKIAKIVKDKTFTICGTPQYMAPQIILNTGYGKQVDWWALGILIYEMSVGIDPFTDEDPMIIYKNILRCRIKFPKELNNETKSIIKHLLVIDKAKRFGNRIGQSLDIKEHRFFKSIDWKKMIEKKYSMKYIPPSKQSYYNGRKIQYVYPPIQSFDQCQQIVQLHPQDDPFISWES